MFKNKQILGVTFFFDAPALTEKLSIYKIDLRTIINFL